MKIYTPFISNLVFPLHEKLKSHTSVAVREEMERVQWQSRQEILALQFQRLKEFLKRVEVNVPYYKDLFELNNFRPDDIRGISDLQKIPFLTKSLIRNNTDGLKSRRASNLAKFNTGGSSGEPLIFFIGKNRVSHDVAAKWRATRWWGVDIGDREIVVWGSPIELKKQDLVKWGRDQLLRTHLIPAFEMSEHNLSLFISKIIQYKPEMLFGYPSSLSLIAQHAQKINQKLDNIGIKVAFVTSEKLYDEQRKVISAVFGCPVANGYGGRDAGFIAHECPLGGMHITSDDIIVEIVDSNGQPQPMGSPGEIVTTHLATEDFPFIRYRTGDIGVLDNATCACGRGLPLLKEIQGRSTDFVRATDGTMMHGLSLIYILRDLPGIDSFKVIQESVERTRVLLVVNSNFTNSNELTIINEFKRRLGSTVMIDIEKLTSIPAEASGKFRYIVSKITH